MAEQLEVLDEVAVAVRPGAEPIFLRTDAWLIVALERLARNIHLARIQAAIETDEQRQRVFCDTVLGPMLLEQSRWLHYGEHLPEYRLLPNIHRYLLLCPTKQVIETTLAFMRSPGYEGQTDYLSFLSFLLFGLVAVSDADAPDGRRVLSAQEVNKLPIQVWHALADRLAEMLPFLRDVWASGGSQSAPIQVALPDVDSFRN